ncbi:GntP family permease [Fuerstiella marisgermanici]|uniref:5-keto-D-gluconate transporter n=1 Tax=Fuerstiella marisgermanici TaxID=1891926 RepID=A0A1P8WQ32_9PLAN|nr:GntP family permease [Fuerstiella marisgermanici]APZ96171.1 5-keto-D-gluconate transporter [Fuerstiella marisgermanici]
MSSFLVVTIGILIVLGLIIGLRINAFIALIVAAIAVSFLAADPEPVDGVEAPPVSMKEKLDRVSREFGSSAGKIGLVIGFAAVIGEAMMRSGAADRIVMAFLSVLGVKRAPWALMGSGFVLSVPVFFDTVFYLLVPLARSLYANTKKNFLLYVLAISAGGAITHTLVPPTPGPLFMAVRLGVPVGLMIFVGSLVAFPAALSGILFATFLDKRIKIESLEDKDETTGGIARDLENTEPTELSSPVPLWEALLPVVLPVILISGDTLVDTLQVKDVTAEVIQVDDASLLASAENNPTFRIDLSHYADLPDVGDTVHVTPQQKLEDGNTAAIPFSPNSFNDIKPYTEIAGNPGLALLLSMTLALITWVRWKKPTGKEFSTAVEIALLSGGLVILITAAGGAFGSMLKVTNIAVDIKALFEDSNAVGLTSLFLAFGMAALLKVAQGSSTTAMITVSSMMASFGLTEAELGFNLVYICTAIGAGSLIGSWMNDSGFWIVAKMSGLSETEALKTWTPLLIVLGCVSLTMTIILSMAMPLLSAG